MVDSPFNEDSKNIIFFPGRPKIRSKEGHKIGEMDNDRDIYCYANLGWSISKENISPYPLVPINFPTCQTKFLKKIEKTQFSGQNLTFLYGLPFPNSKDVSKNFSCEQTSYVMD